jgi:hypothetical protein
LHAVEGELLFLLRQEGGALRTVGEVPEGKDGEAEGAAAFDDEEVAPVGDFAGVDLEDAWL